MKAILTPFFPLFFIALPLFGQGQAKLYPKNEVYKDSSLTEFVCRLQYAIFKKDKSYLLSVVDKDIKNSFGGDDGIEEFKQMWDLDNPNSGIWLLLSKLISLGGNFHAHEEGSISHDQFEFPYVFGLDLPNESLDYFTIMAITGTQVNVREKPDLRSKVLGQLSYDLVTVDYEKSAPPFNEKKVEHLTYIGDKEWYFITTLDKKLSGYVYWDYAWSPLDYRMILLKKNGKWKITCLIAGD